MKWKNPQGCEVFFCSSLGDIFGSHWREGLLPNGLLTAFVPRRRDDKGQLGVMDCE